MDAFLVILLFTTNLLRFLTSALNASTRFLAPTLLDAISYVLLKLHDHISDLSDSLSGKASTALSRYNYHDIYHCAQHHPAFVQSVKSILDSPSTFSLIMELDHIQSLKFSDLHLPPYIDAIDSFIIGSSSVCQQCAHVPTDCTDALTSVLTTFHDPDLFMSIKSSRLISVSSHRFTITYYPDGHIRIRIRKLDNSLVQYEMTLNELYFVLIAIQICVFQYLEPPPPIAKRHQCDGSQLHLLRVLHDLSFYTSRPHPYALSVVRDHRDKPWTHLPVHHPPLLRRPKLYDTANHIAYYTTTHLQAFFRTYSAQAYLTSLPTTIGNLSVMSSTYAYKAHATSPSRIQTGVRYSVDITSACEFLFNLDHLAPPSGPTIPGQYPMDEPLHYLQQMIAKIKTLPAELVHNILLHAIFPKFFVCQCNLLECRRPSGLHDDFCRIGRSRPNARLPRFYPTKLHVTDAPSSSAPSILATVSGIATSETSTLPVSPGFQPWTRPRKSHLPTSGNHVILSPRHGIFMTWLTDEQIDSDPGSQLAADPHPDFPLLTRHDVSCSPCPCTLVSDDFYPKSLLHPDHLSGYD